MGADLTTIVVNWNTVGLLDECLASIVAATPTGLVNEIVVVDNASTDGSAEHVEDNWPGVRVLHNERNEGFCRANNRAIRETDSDTVLLVNTDARLRPDGIAGLLAYFERDDRAAVVGPRLEYADGTFQRWTAGRLPDLLSMSAWLLGWERIRWPGNDVRGLYLARDTTTPFRPEWVTSAVMALRRSALDEIGLLDERIFVYMDDVDLCGRAVAAGWHVWYAADVTAVHFMGASSGSARGAASPEAIRALNRWFRREHGRPAAKALQAIEVAGFAARAGAHGARSLLGRPHARDRARHHLTHLRLAWEPIDA